MTEKLDPSGVLINWFFYVKHIPYPLEIAELVRNCTMEIIVIEAEILQLR